MKALFLNFLVKDDVGWLFISISLLRLVFICPVCACVCIYLCGCERKLIAWALSVYGETAQLWVSKGALSEAGSP